MNFNILIADDDDVICAILVLTVKKFFAKEYPFLNLNITTAQNGKKALEIEEKNTQDIILTDISMPVMDGFEFIKKVRLFDKSVPILVLSVLDDEDNIDKIIQSGATNYTSKPLNKKLFLAQIKVFVDFFIRRQYRYNSRAVNLFSKNIYKRKTEFFIEKEDDLFEFWEFTIENILDKYKMEKILYFIYDIELLMIKKGLPNSIILEESYEKFYLSLSEMDKVKSEIILNMIKKRTLNEAEYKTDNFFLCFAIFKKEEDVKPTLAINAISTIKNNNIKEKRDIPDDIRYSIHENITPNEFLSELDPSYEDKVENFLGEINFILSDISKLKKAPLKETRELIENIINYFNTFNMIVDNIGFFSVINRSFGQLTNFLKNIDDEILANTQKRILLSEMLQGLSSDLEAWMITLFIERTANDIHYFDASFSENCFAIESVFKHEDEDEDGDDDDLEFF